MPRTVRIIAILFGLLLLSGLAVACGGGGDGADEPTATAVEEATEEPDQPEAPEPTTAPAADSPFDSFHYTVDLDFTIFTPGEPETPAISGSVEGDFVAPDSHAFTSTFAFVGLSGTEEIVIIGDDAWYREGSADWRATTRFDPDVANSIDLTSADPGFLQDQEFAENLAVLDSEPDTINGVDVRRYFIPNEAVEALATILGDEFVQDLAGIEEFEMEVWLEERSGALVRAEISVTAGGELIGGGGSPFDLTDDSTVTLTMVINITQINDRDIDIEPPI